jgi:hypothetical protein
MCWIDPLGTNVSSTSSLVEFSTNVNSTWNQQKRNHVIEFRLRFGWKIGHGLTLMTFCKSNQFSMLIQRHHIDFLGWNNAGTMLIQPVFCPVGSDHSTLFALTDEYVCLAQCIFHLNVLWRSTLWIFIFHCRNVLKRVPATEYYPGFLF